MFLDAKSEKILQYLIDCDKLQPNKWVETKSICKYFTELSEFDVSQIITLLTGNNYIDAMLDDCGVGDVMLLYNGKVYFETKSSELEMQKTNVTINNSHDFNVGNNNTINVATGITAEEAIRLVEQSTFSDKEALKEVITLLNDALQNNKPIEPNIFQKLLKGVKSLAPLIEIGGKLLISKMTGQL